MYSRTSFICKYKTSTLTQFLKPCDILNLVVQNVFYVQWYVESEFTQNSCTSEINPVLRLSNFFIIPRSDFLRLDFVHLNFAQNTFFRSRKRSWTTYGRKRQPWAKIRGVTHEFQYQRSTVWIQSLAQFYKEPIYF